MCDKPAHKKQITHPRCQLQVLCQRRCQAHLVFALAAAIARLLLRLLLRLLSPKTSAMPVVVTRPSHRWAQCTSCMAATSESQSSPALPTQVAHLPVSRLCSSFVASFLPTTQYAALKRALLAQFSRVFHQILVCFICTRKRGRECAHSGAGVQPYTKIW